MAKKNFTLDDIKNYLEELGFVWKDKIIYNPNSRKYKTATVKSFEKDVFLLLKRANKDVLMLATINNITFELRCDSNKLDASDGWFEFLEEKNKKVSI